MITDSLSLLMITIVIPPIVVCAEPLTWYLTRYSPTDGLLLIGSMLSTVALLEEVPFL